MPILVDQETIKITVEDGATGASITFLSRRPNTAEQLAWDRGVAKGKAKGTGQRVRKLALKMAKPLIQGIEFGDPDTALAWKKDGKPVILSSTPGEEGYREDWLAVIEAFNPGLLRLLGLKMFAGETLGEDDYEDEGGAPN